MKSIKFLLVLLLSAGFMTGCFEDVDKTYQGPSVVEFKPAPGSSNSYIRVVNVNSTSANSTIPVTIQLVGPHQASNVDVNFAVSGTATAAMFNIGGTTASIPSGSSSGVINVNVTPAAVAALATGQSRDIVLTLTGGSLPLNEMYKTFTVRLTRVAG
jgi:hypothetical protein